MHIPQRVQAQCQRKTISIPGTQTPQLITFSFLGSPVLNSAELDTLSDLERCWGWRLTGSSLLYLTEPPGRMRTLPGPLNTVYPDHLLQLKPLCTHTAPGRRASLIRRDVWGGGVRKQTDEQRRTAHKRPSLQHTSGAALSPEYVWIQSDSFPGSNTSVTGRVRERHTEREREGEGSCSSHLKPANVEIDSFISQTDNVSCPPD